MLATITGLLLSVIDWYIVLLIARFIVSLLISLGILDNTRKVTKFVDYVTGVLVDPVLVFIKKYAPWLVVHNIDLSPVAFYLILQAVEYGLIHLI